MEPNSYDRCPVTAALEVFGGKWKPVILFQLSGGTLRFSELRRAVSGSTQKMLTQQLRELERDGVIGRKVYAVVPPRVEYSLTPHGQTLRPVLKAMCEWGNEHRLLAKRRKPKRAAAAA